MILMAVVLASSTAPTQRDLDAQAGSAFTQADAAMNAQYQATMAAMRSLDGFPPTAIPLRRTGPSHANMVLQAQRAWLAYRDAECAAEGYNFRGGSAEGMSVDGCKTRLTIARTAELKDGVQ